MKKFISLFSLIATFALVSLFSLNPVSADELNLEQLDPDEKDVQTITDPDELEPFKEKFGEKHGDKKLGKGKSKTVKAFPTPLPFIKYNSF